MRVLVPNHFPLEGSGSGIYAQNVARELVKKGHHALAITPAHEPQLGYPFDVRTILFMTDLGAEAGDDRLPFNFPCFTTHPRSSLTFGDLDDAQRSSYVSAFQDAIEAAVRDWSPDVIHAQHLWVAPYAASKTSVPYVVTAHGTDLMGFRRYPDWREISLEGTRLARAVIAISRQVASDAMALYDIPPERVKLIMNGFDESIFHTMNLDRAKVLRSFGIDNLPEVVITFVGKLTSFKGVDVLLEAASIYESRLGDAMTLIVGDGDLHDRLLSQSKSLGLKDVRFLGHQPQPKIARLLNISNLSVVPSRVEPFGLVAVEALACGTPVIATNEGGLVDFVDERVGWLVDVDDPDQLSDAIIEAIRSDAKTNKGPVAASYAIESFSWSQQVDKMISVYREVLGD